MTAVPAPSPALFLTKRQRAVRRLVGLNPDVLYSTGWSSWDDQEALDALDDLDFTAPDVAHSGGCPVCRAFGMDHEGQDRP